MSTADFRHLYFIVICTEVLAGFKVNEVKYNKGDYMSYSMCNEALQQQLEADVAAADNAGSVLTVSDYRLEPFKHTGETQHASIKSIPLLTFLIDA